MKTLRKIEVSEITGAWIITVDDVPKAYSQAGRDYLRFAKDLLKHFELHNLLEVKERGGL